MARPIRFTPKKTSSGWRLNIPPKISETGKRQQLFYRTRALAETAAADLKTKVETFGIQARAIAPTLAEQATAAAAILRPFNLTVLDAAEIVASMRRKESASRTIKAATADWILSCEGLRDRTLDGYNQIVKRLVAALGDRIMTTITPDELQAAVAPLGTSGAAVTGRIRNARAFWRWAAKKEWCDAAIFDKVEMPRENRDSDEIAILTVDQAENLLRVAEAHFPQAVASFAIQLFAGVRAEEITRLVAENVSADGIELGASITKKGRRRHITLSPTLAEWLERHPFTPCSNWLRVSRAVRHLAGWNIAADPDLVKEPLEATSPPRPAWPQNCMRHSHASYAVAAGTPLESLLFEFGHVGNPTVLRQHYVGRASKKQALEYFAIRPDGKAAAGSQLSTVEGAA